MNDNIFHFKQFDVDQSGCGMKVNTDGVLLGAIASADNPKNILDIGTGTGVIALMLAQRFPDSFIQAVEIEQSASKTAARNFKNSAFSTRMNLYFGSFQEFSKTNPENKFDLIVTNPPFFIDSLKNPDQKKVMARHTNQSFFNDLLDFSSRHITENGQFWVILQVDSGNYLTKAAELKELLLEQRLTIHSYMRSDAHRCILSFSFISSRVTESTLMIYEEERVYSEDYRFLLKEFLTIF